MLRSNHRVNPWRLVIGIACLGMLLGTTGCGGGLAGMAVRHVAGKAGMKVAKGAYKKLKGKDKEKVDPAVPVMQQEILVTSTPPGVRIEVNKQYVGITPVKVRLEIDPRGGVNRTYTIQAIASEEGQHTQRWRLTHYRDEPSDRPPARIVFDMNKQASP